jgi:hypothetical protein
MHRKLYCHADTLHVTEQIVACDKFRAYRAAQLQIQLKPEAMDGFIFKKLEGDAMSKRHGYGLVQDLVTGIAPGSVDARMAQTVNA